MYKTTKKQYLFMERNTINLFLLAEKLRWPI